MVDTNTQCSQCGEAFRCVSLDDKAKFSECWCQSLPAILPIDNKVGCLCSHCLKQRIVDSLPGYLESIGHEKSLELAERYPLDTPLEEGIDYQVEEGYTVFSSWYHLKRGYCCGNGCRHCPYSKNDG